MLLRNETQMALSQVETLCFEAADRAAAAVVRSGGELARLFDVLAQQHREFAEELAGHIRALDDLPQQPDPDRETIDEMLSSIKALLSGDAQQTLIDECIRIEQALLDAATAALHANVPAAAQSVLQRIASHAEQALRDLSAQSGPKQDG